MSSKRGRQSVLSSFIPALLTALLLGMMTVATACGGGSSTQGAAVSPTGPTASPTPTPTASPTPTGSPSPTPTPVATFTTAQLRIGDAPVDRVIDFEVSFGPGPLVVTVSTGQTFNLTVQNNRWELSHTAANLEPLTVQDLPQGAITAIQIPLSNPEVTYLDDAGTLQQFTGSSPQTANVILNPPLVIGSTPVIVTLDINVASTLSYNQGKVTAINFSGSTFTLGAKPIAAPSVQQDDDGEIEGVTGTVTLVNGNSFDLDAGQGGASLTFVTDNTTRFDGVTLGTLLKKIVKVNGYTRANGSLFASEIEGLEGSASGSELEGMIIAEDGPPLSSNPPQITILVQDGNGLGMDQSKMGQSYWVAIDSGRFSNYTVDWGDIVNVGWAFDGREISPAQRVEVELPTGVPSNPGDTTGVPAEIKLEQQSITGQVKNFNAATNEFDLALPPDSYVTLLTKVTSVHVFLKSETEMRIQPITNNATVRVRGLLFFTLTADISNLGPKPWGYFRMIARRVTAP